MSSQLDKNALIRLLTEPMVPPTSTPEEVMHMVESMTVTKLPSFYKEEILNNFPDQNYALNISVEVMGKTDPLAHVHNDSTPNVFPLKNLN